MKFLSLFMFLLSIFSYATEVHSWNELCNEIKKNTSEIVLMNDIECTFLLELTSGTIEIKSTPGFQYTIKPESNYKGSFISLKNGIHVKLSHLNISNFQNKTIQSNTKTNHTLLYGAIYNDHSNIEISDCSFYGNSFYYGGAIFNNSGSITLSHCSFWNNSSYYNPNLSYYTSNLENVSGGGAIFNNSGNITLSHCFFMNNSSNLFNTTDDNEAGGGAIFNNSGSVTLSHCSLSNNSSNYGGAIDNEANGSMNITDCSFSNNVVSDDGGAIWNGGNMTIENCSFSNNNASSFGSAVCNYNTMNLTSCSFSGNIAHYSGCVFNYNIMNLVNCSFFNNTAKYNGGALCNYVTMNIINCSFSGNFAERNGGAISNSHDLHIYNSILYGNYDSNGANDLYNNKGTLSLYYCLYGIENTTQLSAIKCIPLKTDKENLQNIFKNIIQKDNKNYGALSEKNVFEIQSIKEVATCGTKCGYYTENEIIHYCYYDTESLSWKNNNGDVIDEKKITIYNRDTLNNNRLTNEKTGYSIGAVVANNVIYN